MGLAILTTNVLNTHDRGVFVILSTVAGVFATIVSGGAAVLAADLIHGRSTQPVLHRASLAIAVTTGFVLAMLAACASSLIGTGTLPELLCTASVTALTAYSYFEMYIAQARGDVKQVSLVVLGTGFFPLAASILAALLVNGTVTTLMAAWAVGALALASIQFGEAIHRGGMVIRYGARAGWSIMGAR